MTGQQQENAEHSIKHLKTKQGSRNCQGHEAPGRVRDAGADFARKDLPFLDVSVLMRTCGAKEMEIKVLGGEHHSTHSTVAAMGLPPRGREAGREITQPSLRSQPQPEFGFGNPT